MNLKNLTQQLTKQELIPLQTALSHAITVHLRWFGEVNKAFICNTNAPQGFCDNDQPYQHCKFGKWYSGVTNIKITENEEFKLIGLYHQDVHMIVCSLIDELKEKRSISEVNYRALLESQNHLFEKLIYFTLSISEAINH